MRAETSSASESKNYMKTLKAFLFSVIIGLVVSLLMLLIFSVVMTMKDTPQGIVPTLSAVSVAVGGFAAGFVCSKILRKSGLLYGTVAGLLLYIVLMLTGMIFGQKSVDISMLAKFAVSVVCGAIGGILGVNAVKRSKY